MKFVLISIYPFYLGRVFICSTLSVQWNLKGKSRNYLSSDLRFLTCWYWWTYLLIFSPLIYQLSYQTPSICLVTRLWLELETNFISCLMFILHVFRYEQTHFNNWRTFHISMLHLNSFSTFNSFCKTVWLLSKFYYEL